MSEGQNRSREGERLTGGQNAQTQPASDLEVVGFPPAPDGGYGWVIVAASFLCNLVVDGIGYSFGILLPELVDYFGKGKGVVAWVGSLVAGTVLVIGPIVSVLCNKYGCRAVCIAGSVLASAAFFISSFSQNVVVMMLTYGILGGFGFGMVYLPSIVAVGYYFDTKRSLATGIAVCGSGVGTVSFPPLTSFLLASLGSWQKTNFVLAAIILGCSLCGALMKPLVFPEPKPLLQQMAEEKNFQMARGSVDGKLDRKSQGENGNIFANPLPRNVSSPIMNGQSAGITKRASVPSLHTKPSFENSLQTPDLLLHGSAPSLFKDCKQSIEFGAVYNSKLSVAKEPARIVRPLSRKDIFYSGSVLNLPQFQSQKSLAAFRNSMASLPQSRAADIEQPDQGKCCFCLPITLKATLSSMMDFGLLRDPCFMLIGASSFFGMAGLYMPFVYIVDAAMLSGVSSGQASFLISIIGITNVVARLICGFIADYPWISSLLLNNICLVLCTVSVGCIPFCSTYGTYIAVVVIFGIGVAGFISLTSIILVDLLGLEKLTNAFGLLILFRGVATIIGSPLAGSVYDATQTYDASFYVGALFFLLSTLCSFAVMFFKKNPETAKQTLDALARIDEEHEEEVFRSSANSPPGYCSVPQTESM